MRSIALVYVRKSLVKSGGTDPASPAMQREVCEKHAIELGLRPEVYEDAEGHNSGKSENRVAWQACRARLADPAVAALVVYSWDRAARNTRVLLSLAEECDNYGVRLIATSDNLDTRTASGRFQLTIVASVGEFESNASSERRIATIDYLRRVKGRHYGTPPFGTERVAQGGDLVLVPSTKRQPNGTDHEALTRAYALYGGGRLSLRKTCLQLNAEGWRWRMRDGALVPWSAEGLRRTLANHMLYAGYVSVGRAYRDAGAELLKGSHAAILPEPLLAPVAGIFAAYQRGPTRRLPLVYPLTGLLFCGRCGQRVSGGTTGRGYRYYRHPLPCGHGPNARAADPLEGQVREYLATRRYPDAMQAEARTEALHLLAGGDGASDAAEQRRVAAALDRLRDLYTWGDIDAEAYRAQQAAIRATLPTPTAASVPAEAGLLAMAGAAREYTPAELMAAVRLLYTRIEMDGECLSYTARGWCKDWA